MMSQVGRRLVGDVHDLNDSLASPHAVGAYDFDLVLYDGCYPWVKSFENLTINVQRVN